MIDTTLIERLKFLADKERKIKEYKRRVRIKGRVAAKERTKKGNITLTIEKNENDVKFTVVKSHKERYALAEKLNIGKSVSIEGIPTFRTIICTRLKIIDKGIAKDKQAELTGFVEKNPEKRTRTVDRVRED